MSRLLLNEQPLLIMPKLAEKIGLNESIVIQQIHYWTDINRKTNKNYKNGYHWTYNSYTEWSEQFPFWSVSTIQRAIIRLEKLKLIVVSNFNRLKIDRTKWYRIDYNVLEALEESPFGQIDMTNISRWHEHLFKLGLPLPENISENSSENNGNTIYHTVNVQLFLNTFEDYFGYEHRKIKSQPDEDNLEDFTQDELIELFEQYFDKYSNGNKKHDKEQCSIDNVFKSFIRASLNGKW